MPWAVPKVCHSVFRAKSIFHCDDGGFDPGMHAEFAQNRFDMQLDRAVGDAQVAGDDLIALPFGQQAEDFRLAWRQIGKQTGAGQRRGVAMRHHFGQHTGQFRCDHRLAVENIL